MVRAELQYFSTYPCTLSGWMRRCGDCDLRLHDPVPLNRPAHPLQDISIDPSSVRRWLGCITILLFFNKNDPCIITLVKLSILRYRTHCAWISVFSRRITMTEQPSSGFVFLCWRTGSGPRGIQDRSKNRMCHVQFVILRLVRNSSATASDSFSIREW